MTVSGCPNSKLQISQFDKKQKKLTKLATSSSATNDINNGFKFLSVNPLDNEYICSAYALNDKPEKQIMIWNLAKVQETLEIKQTAESTKRQKLSTGLISPNLDVRFASQVTSLHWCDPLNILAAGSDHSIQMINSETAQI